MPVPKAHCSSPAAAASSALLASTEDMDQRSKAGAPYLVLDVDESTRAALQDALPYMLIFYNLLKSLHDTNAAALAELENSHATNAAALAENSRVLDDPTRTLNSLASRVDEFK